MTSASGSSRPAFPLVLGQPASRDLVLFVHHDLKDGAHAHTHTAPTSVS